MPIKKFLKIIFFFGPILLLTGSGCASTSTANNKAKSLAVGVTPFAYPIVAQTTAQTGEYVLAPERDLLAEKFGEVEKEVFVYYASIMLEPGIGESKIRTDGNYIANIPNSMIIPLAKGATAKLGDLVLTWWQSGAGMQRALVVGGSVTEPEVYYLDRDILPVEKPEKLKPNSFVVLTDGANPGISAACKKGAHVEYYVLTGAAENKYLATSWTGKLRSFFKNECQLAPIDSRVFKVGDTVWAPVLGTYQLVKIKTIDSATGRITVVYKIAGKEYQAQAVFGSVIKDLKL